MPRYDTSARKRAVTLTLNEDLVGHARRLTGDLSGVVERLLSEYVERQDEARGQRGRVPADTISAWNGHSAKHGSFAGEHARL